VTHRTTTFASMCLYDAGWMNSGMGMKIGGTIDGGRSNGSTIRFLLRDGQKACNCIGLEGSIRSY